MEIIILSTQYANEDNSPTIVGVFSSKAKARAWINKDKKRIREQDLTPYESDYIVKEYELDAKC